MDDRVGREVAYVCERVCVHVHMYIHICVCVHMTVCVCVCVCYLGRVDRLWALL